jgi:hypothetical protein
MSLKEEKPTLSCLLDFRVVEKQQLVAKWHTIIKKRGGELGWFVPIVDTSGRHKQELDLFD